MPPKGTCKKQVVPIHPKIARRMYRIAPKFEMRGGAALLDRRKKPSEEKKAKAFLKTFEYDWLGFDQVESNLPRRKRQRNKKEQPARFVSWN